MAVSLCQDSPRWSRQDQSLRITDLAPLLTTAIVWLLVLLSGRSLLESLAHSPIQYAARTWLIAIALVATVSTVLPLTRRAGVRRAVRAAASLLSVGAGCLVLGFMVGVWITTRTPGLLTDYAMEATVPGLVLLALGVAGMISLSPRLSSTPTDPPAGRTSPNRPAQRLDASAG